MDSAWIKIIKITGSVGVVALLLSLLMNHLFNEQIINVLGSEKIFFIIVLIASGLLVSLLVAINKPKPSKKLSNPDEQNRTSKNIEITYDNGSKHNGDNNF